MSEPVLKKPKLLETNNEEKRDGLSSPKNTLYLRNLNDKIREHILRENLYLMFSVYGEVLKISITRKQRGQAFVIFSTIDEANLAKISLDGEPLFGKILKIEFSKQNTFLI